MLPQVSGDARLETILTGLSGPPVASQGSNWTFLDVERTSLENHPFLAGTLARYEAETEGEIADEERHVTVRQDIRNAIIASAAFFIHLGRQENLMAFHITDRITEKQFRDRFMELFRKAHRDFFIEPWLEPVTEEMEIWEALRSFERIFRFRIKLHRPNPRMDDKWKIVAEDLVEKNASEYREEYVADKKSSGLNLSDDEKTKAKIQMAEDGYGEAEITGLKNGKDAVASTTSVPVRAEVPATETSREGVIRVLGDKFQSLWDRFGAD